MLGRLAGGIAGGMLSEGARQLARGERPAVGELLLTPANARRLADRLSEMRGAAMKVGQLLSMDSGHLLPAELSRVLERLREGAHAMPLGQVATVLNGAWGAGWESRFERFFFQPVAAASIGQVHDALLKDGRRLAIKLQYPGIRRSIDSDVDNVASLLRLFRLVPEEIDVAPLLEEAKQQLHLEADYRHEASALAHFATRIAGDPRYQVPEVITDLSGEDVLAMSYLDGQPIDSLADAPAAQRDEVASALFVLALQEVFDWGLVQTDPNFANYLYDPRAGRIQLLDFGATREYPQQRRDDLAGLLAACLDGDDADIAAAASRVGYLGEGDPGPYRDSVVELLRIATEPARQITPYRFTDNALAQRMSDKLIELRITQRYARLPPTEILFLHRKLGGLYLLMARLRATLPVRQLLEPYRTAYPRQVAAG
jgi:predicted unusual protein kinase regulating ubiquinone biosynthesis (AarF/ABC1/UbiB family)